MSLRWLTNWRGPRGKQGPANKLKVGTVTTLAPGSPAHVTIAGEPGDQTVSFGVPAGVNAGGADTSDAVVATFAAQKDSATGTVLNAQFGADAIRNPETAINGAVVEIVRRESGGGADRRLIVVWETLDDIRFPRPIFEGVVQWMVRAGSPTPPAFKPGDIVVEVAVEPAPWRPTDHPFLAAWWNPLNTGAAHGTRVESLADAGANGWTLVQPTTANRPTYHSAGINGQPAIQFTGTEYLKTPVIAGGARIPSTMYFVIKGSDVVNSGGSRFFVDLLTGSTAVGGAAGRSAANKWTYTAGATTATTVDSDHQPHIITIRTGADGITEILVDGALRATSVASTTRATFDGVSIGARGDGANGWKGFVGDVVFVSAATSGTTHTEMMNFLAKKYGMVLP